VNKARSFNASAAGDECVLSASSEQVVSDRLQ
jgi:hypothetical protein